MKSAIQSRKRPTGAITLALLTALAVLAAPLCAPLCAARTCLTSTESEHCHAMGAMDAKVGGQFLAAVNTCGGAELLAVLSTSNESNMSSPGAGNDPPPILLRESHRRGFEDSDTSLWRLGVYRVQPDLQDSLLITTILRI